jgi:hypothetical protein
LSEMKIKSVILILIAGILLISSNSMPLVNAQPVPTSLTLAIPSPPTEKECTIEATLKDEKGNPLSNMDIDFYFCGTDKVGTNKTDLYGVASLKLSDDLPLFSYPKLDLFETKKTATWKINAVFKGTTNYVQSSSKDAYVAFVLINYTPYMAAGGLIALAIIVALGYIVFRRRKKQ